MVKTEIVVARAIAIVIQYQAVCLKNINSFAVDERDVCFLVSQSLSSFSNSISNLFISFFVRPVFSWIMLTSSVVDLRFFFFYCFKYDFFDLDFLIVK